MSKLYNMKIKSFTISLIFLFIYPFNSIRAGIFDEVSGSRSAALGFNSICLTDFWSAINNQAGLASIDRMTTGIFVENKFMIQSLSTKSIALALPLPNGTFGLSLSQFGETEYNETHIGISYGMKLTEKLSAGIQLFHYAINQNNELGRAGVFSFQGGFIYEHDKNFRIAFHFFNPEFISTNINKPELAGITKIGMSYRLSGTLEGFLEVQSYTKFGNGINSGIEYRNSDKFAFRIGYSSFSEKITFGIGLKLKNLMLDFSSSMHNALGYSPQLSIIYEF